VLELIIYGTYAALIGGGVGLMVGEPKARAWLRRRRVAGWGRTAAQLGLYWHGSNDRMSGWLRGRFVAVWSQTMPSMPSMPIRTHVAVALFPPLDIGLMATIEPGRSELSVAGADRDRAQQLTNPLRSFLEAGRSDFIRLDDERVLLIALRIESGPAITAMLEQALEIARRVDAARALVSPAADAVASVGRDWHKLATARRCAMQSTPFGFCGVDRGLEVRAYMRRRADGRLTASAMAAFRRPLQIGFQANPRRPGVEPPWSTQPLQTGDAEFDERFLVFASEHQYVRQALSEAARSRLCELVARWGSVFVDDYGVRIDAELVAADRLEQMLDDAHSAAKLVDFLHPGPQSSYRG
jgi:hypothetical protein